MHEQVSLGGAQAIGFGDEQVDISPGAAIVYKPLIGYVAGAAAGAVVGSLVHKSRVSTGIGGAVGGLVGMYAGARWFLHDVGVDVRVNEKAAEAEQTPESGVEGVGFGNVNPPVVAAPWGVALTASVLGAATSWALEEMSRSRRSGS